MSAPRHIVGLSGGKDSCAMAAWLAKNEPRPYEFICNFTGNELPEMLAHWANLERILGAKITPVTHSANLIELCEQMQMLPNFRARWCTRILKIEPTIEFMEQLPPGSVLYVGLRADEPMREGLYGEDLTIRFPLREQGFNIDDVWRICDENGICIPARTDCALCPYQRLEEWFALWRDHPDLFQQGIELEWMTGHTFRSDSRDTWPASLYELGREFATGRPLRKSNSKAASCRVCSL